MGIETIRYTDLGLIDPVGVVGFPSVGLVSSIAANYYVSQLKLTPIAGLMGSTMPPYSLVTDGVAYPPIRMYGRKRTSKTGRDVVFCTSEYAPKPEDCYDISVGVLRTLRDLGCREVVCMEGIPIEEGAEPVICANGPGTERMVEASGLQKMENGMVKGVSGIMMYQGYPMGMGVATVLCPANPGLPDPGSAAAFVEPLSRIVKGLKVNTKVLMEEAAEVKRRVEEQIQEEKEDSVPSTIYG